MSGNVFKQTITPYIGTGSCSCIEEPADVNQRPIVRVIAVYSHPCDQDVSSFVSTSYGQIGILGEEMPIYTGEKRVRAY